MRTDLPNPDRGDYWLGQGYRNLPAIFRTYGRERRYYVCPSGDLRVPFRGGKLVTYATAAEALAALLAIERRSRQ